MKLATKIFFYVTSFILLFIAILHFSLMYVLPIESVKTKIISILEEQTLAKISIESVSASIFDFQINNVNISIKDEQILHADKAYIHFSLIHLIAKKIKVQRITFENLDITIIKDAEGHFNFEPVLSSPMFSSKPEVSNKEQEESESLIDLFLYKTQLHNSHVLYIDKQSDITCELDKISFNIESFKFDNSFKVNIFTNVSAKISDLKIDSLYIGLTAFINLHSINTARAEVNVTQLTLRFQETILIIKGIISDFDNPKANMMLKIFNLSSKTFKAFADIPDFAIPLINIHYLINVNINDSVINIEDIDVKTMDSSINVKGKVDYGKKELVYDLNVFVNLILQKIGQAVEMVKIYKPSGTLQASVNINDTPSMIKGKLTLTDISVFTPKFGDITDINSIIKIKNINNIQMPSMTGKINSYPFQTTVSYLIGKDSGNISAKFKAKKIFGKMSKEYEKALNSSQPQKKNSETKNDKEISSDKPKKQFLPPLHIKADFEADDIDAPFFMGKNIVFKMDMENITPLLTDVKGNLSLTSADGTIKDIYKLTQSNAIMKGLFVSLKVISDVINALNIIDILGSIGSIIAPSDNNIQNSSDTLTTEEKAIRNKKIDGKIDFNSFITSIDFADGKGIFKHCSFVSNLLSFKVTGEMNFRNNLLDMAVNAAPGIHEEDGGIMPLTITIGGTVEEPSGSLSILGSISTLVGDALTKNIVSGSLKSGFMNLLGLKKYDEAGNEIKESSQTLKQ